VSSRARWVLDAVLPAAGRDGRSLGAVEVEEVVG
jgi:hypothetical protein